MIPFPYQMGGLGLVGGRAPKDATAASILAKLSRWYTLDSDYRDSVSGFSTVTNDVAYSGTTGKVGQGAASPRFRMANPSGSIINSETQKASMGCWVNISSFASNRIIMAVSQNATAGEMLRLAALTSGRFSAAVTNSSGTMTTAADTNGARTTGVWYLVGFDYDNLDVRLRVNGTTVTSATKASGTGLRTASYFEMGSTFSNTTVPGTVDEAFICYRGDACLDDTEWAYLYNAGAGNGYNALFA